MGQVLEKIALYTQPSGEGSSWKGPWFAQYRETQAEKAKGKEMVNKVKEQFSPSNVRNPDQVDPSAHGILLEEFNRVDQDTKKFERTIKKFNNRQLNVLNTSLGRAIENTKDKIKELRDLPQTLGMETPEGFEETVEAKCSEFTVPSYSAYREGSSIFTSDSAIYRKQQEDCLIKNLRCLEAMNEMYDRVRKAKQTDRRPIMQ